VIQFMLRTVVDAARDGSPELCRRYRALILLGMRADPTEIAPLPLDSLNDDEQLDHGCAPGSHQFDAKGAPQTLAAPSENGGTPPCKPYGKWVGPLANCRCVDPGHDAVCVTTEPSQLLR
jgi:hypothetical protein